jgi:plastocyanin
MVRRNRWWSLVALVAVVVASALACSKDKSTSPTGGGGGAKELNSPNLGSGAMYSDTFPATLITYPYHCKIHSFMTASVVVSSGGPASAAVTISGSAFNPNSVTVGPGGVVTWTNNDATTHTVTSD